MRHRRPRLHHQMQTSRKERVIRYEHRSKKGGGNVANFKAVKRKMSKWGVLGNAFLSVVLAVSLMPSYAAFGDDGQEESPKATQEQNQQVVNERTADGVQGDGEDGLGKIQRAGHGYLQRPGRAARPYAVYGAW